MQCPRCKSEITPLDVNISAVLDEAADAVNIDLTCGGCGHTMYAAIEAREFQ